MYQYDTPQFRLYGYTNSLRNTAIELVPGGIGVQNANLISNEVYTFDGQSTIFQQKVQQLANQPDANTVKGANIIIIGDMVNDYNFFCTVLTFMFACLIFPIFFICCDWWKRMTHATYVVPLSAYQALDKVFALPNLRNLTLKITDNGFGREKIDLLYNMVEKSDLQSFTLVNLAGMYNASDDEFSEFKERMRRFKNLKVITDFRWHEEVVN